MRAVAGCPLLCFHCWTSGCQTGGRVSAAMFECFNGNHFRGPKTAHKRSPYLGQINRKTILNPTLLDKACGKHPKRKRNNGELFKARKMSSPGAIQKVRAAGHELFSLKMHRPVEFLCGPCLDTCVRVSCLFVPSMDYI